MQSTLHKLMHRTLHVHELSAHAQDSADAARHVHSR
jgi:hypothetical protein